MKRRPDTTLFLAFSLTLSLAPLASAGEITLRRAVRMPVDRHELTLADVAVLNGEDAEALGATIVWRNTDPARLAQIPRAAIRVALEEAGAHWGKLHFTGGDVTVRPRPAVGTGAPTPMEAVSIDRPEVTVPREYREDTFLAAGIMHEQTLRGAIALRFTHTLQIDGSDLRLTFDLDDADLLATDLTAHRVEVQPTSSLRTDRATFVVRFWERGAVVRSQSLGVSPLIRAPMCQLTRDLARGEAILPSDIVPSSEWISPAHARRYPAADDLIGRLAARGLKGGTVLREQDVRRETLVTRGEQVTVRCRSGSVVITLVAEARSDASLGDQVELRKLGERDTFFAEVSGPGEAVVSVNDQNGRM